MKSLLFLILCIFCFNYSYSQLKPTAEVLAEKQWLKSQISILTSNTMHGRGYVKNGKDYASAYIQKKFKEFKLKPVNKNGSYVQAYSCPINTFPGTMKLSFNGTELKPGEDYIIDPAASGIKLENAKVEDFDVEEVKDLVDWQNALVKCDTTGATVYKFVNLDIALKNMNIKRDRIGFNLPKGAFIVPMSEKLTWSVSRDTCPSTVFYVKELAIPKKFKTVDADVTAVLNRKVRNENVVGYIEGSLLKDSFFVFTAHYDHLGMMGDTTMFPGASDNASGVATMLYLANYFSTHIPRYSVLFIAFSGEEPGLRGSTFYVANPLIPLNKMFFLTNIDIMGDASDGVTVVNATEFPTQFQLLQDFNKQYNYVPVIKSRGKAANSDHYPFTEAGVKSFFIYSNGGKGYYHDVYDKVNEVTLNHVDGVIQLLIDFVRYYN